jgi:hypothetical protein
VVFVPIIAEFSPTQMIWRHGNTSSTLRRMVDVVTDLAAATDLTATG